jgi:hypothetical protein
MNMLRDSMKKMMLFICGTIHLLVSAMEPVQGPTGNNHKRPMLAFEQEVPEEHNAHTENYVLNGSSVFKDRKDVLQLLHYIVLLSPEQEQQALVYKLLSAQNLTFNELKHLLIKARTMSVPQSCIAGIACRGAEKLVADSTASLVDLDSTAQSELNKFYFLLSGRCLEGVPLLYPSLEEMLTVKKLDSSILKENYSLLDLQGYSLRSVTNLAELNCKLYIPLGFLIIINLSYNKLSTMPQDLLVVGFPFLQELWLDHNELVEVVPLRALYCPHLKKLGLQYNKLTRIPDTLVAELSALEELWLHNNQIQSVPPHLVYNCPALGILTLTNNALATLSMNLERCTRLHTLGLGGNYLEQVPEALLTLCMQVQKLDLSHNRISSLSSTFLTRLYALTELYLQDNPIQTTYEELPLFLQNAINRGNLVLQRKAEGNI